MSKTYSSSEFKRLIAHREIVERREVKQSTRELQACAFDTLDCDMFDTSHDDDEFIAREYASQYRDAHSV